MEASVQGFSISESHIYTDSLAFQPQVIQTSVRGLVTPTALPTATRPLDITQLHKAIGLYGPILYLHPEEKYFNTSIEDFLQHCSLVNRKTGTEIKSPKPDSLPQSG